MPDDYDVFLDSWSPSEGVELALLPHYLSDPLMKERALQDYDGAGPAVRAQNVGGIKKMDEEELSIRRYEFFVKKQPEWSADFKERLLEGDIPGEKVDRFISCFAKDWVDGPARRQKSEDMISIKCSIRDFDSCRRYISYKFVHESLVGAVSPFFTPDEMSVVFETNQGMVETYMQDYISELNGNGATSLGELYVRRGVYMPDGEHLRLIERNYLSSYSLSLGPVEQFAQTRASQTKQGGSACVFSTELGTIQHRIVAFAPFIEGMSLGQMELVVAPPLKEIHLKLHGTYGGIKEYTFS